MEVASYHTPGGGCTCNRQRVKTASERMREAEQLGRIIAEEARRRMLAGKPADPVPMLAQGPNDERKTRTRLAGAVGMKSRTFAKVEGVYHVDRGGATDGTHGFQYAPHLLSPRTGARRAGAFVANWQHDPLPGRGDAARKCKGPAP